MDDLMDD